MHQGKLLYAIMQAVSLSLPINILESLAQEQIVFTYANGGNWRALHNLPCDG